ncbi:MAG: hypothetical protein GEU75_16145 [Dehalococcoidia bacterium]|nr:hypothetical protein [Dehalococcoidia bacterium]
MRPVSDSFLLTMAEISAGLVGLFLVGVLFYVETGFHRAAGREVVEPYIRAATAIVLVLYAIPIGLSLTLVALEPIWSRVLFALLSILLVAVNIQTVIHLRGLVKAGTSAVVVTNEIVSTLAVIPLLLTPWVLGGLEPTREDLTWSILLAFALGFLSIGALVLSTFDIAQLEVTNQPGAEE